MEAGVGRDGGGHVEGVGGRALRELDAAEALLLPDARRVAGTSKVVYFESLISLNN